MATCRDIITDALKLARAISPGEAPTSDEANDGLTCLQSLYDSWVHSGMFGTLEDVTLEENDAAEEGKRYFVPTGLTLTAATSEYDDNGTIRQPYDLSIYESLTEAGTRSVKLYDRTEWVELTGLSLSSTAPLSSRDRMGLAACLATNGAFGAMFSDTATTNPDVRVAARRFLGSIIGKQGSTQATRTSDYY